jgi:hypothetical protein
VVAALAILSLRKAPVPEDGSPIRTGVHVHELSEADARRMAGGGVELIRTPFQWQNVQPEEDGPFDWSAYDDFMASASRNGLDVLPLISGSPDYAATEEGVAQPRGAEDLRRFREFVTMMVGRYGHGGRFWREHPELPNRPIAAWQVWNEPNLRAFWAGEPDPAAYAKLLRLTRGAILRADRKARIVLAGLSGYKVDYSMKDYLSGLYSVPGARELFDVVAVHGYSGTPAEVAQVATTAREVMARHGDRGKDLWMTEVGWGSDGPARDVRVVSPDEQAELLAELVARLEGQPREERPHSVVWYSWRDQPVPDGDPDRYHYHAGLISRAGIPKPAWEAFTEAATRR